MTTGNLVRLNYASTATFESNAGGGIEVEVARILSVSRRNNARLQISGVLHFGQGFFFQCLEGDRDTVNRLYNHIARDPRHTDVQLLSFEEPGQRMFPDWSMKYLPIESEINKVLRRHGVDFNPYRFNAAVLEDLLRTCVLGRDPTEELRSAGAESAPQGEKPPLWRRLLGKAG